MRSIIAAMLVVFLAGCSTTKSINPIVSVPTPIMLNVPANLFNCPTVKEFPNPDTLTNKEVAELLITLDLYSRTCSANMGAIRSYIDRLEALIAEYNARPTI